MSETLQAAAAAASAELREQRAVGRYACERLIAVFRDGKVDAEGLLIGIAELSHGCTLCAAAFREGVAEVLAAELTKPHL